MSPRLEKALAALVVASGSSGVVEAPMNRIASILGLRASSARMTLRALTAEGAIDRLPGNGRGSVTRLVVKGAGKAPERCRKGAEKVPTEGGRGVAETSLHDVSPVFPLRSAFPSELLTAPEEEVSKAEPSGAEETAREKGAGKVPERCRKGAGKVPTPFADLAVKIVEELLARGPLTVVHVHKIDDGVRHVASLLGARVEEVPVVHPANSAAPIQPLPEEGTDERRDLEEYRALAEEQGNTEQAIDADLMRLMGQPANRVRGCVASVLLKRARGKKRIEKPCGLVWHLLKHPEEPLEEGAAASWEEIDQMLGRRGGRVGEDHARIAGRHWGTAADAAPVAKVLGLSSYGSTEDTRR